MAAVSVTIALRAKPEVKCDVNIERDSDGKRTWQRFGWSVGGLDLLTDTGRWFYREPDRTLYLVDNDLEYIVASASQLRSNFLIQVVCGKSLSSDGEVYVRQARGYRVATWDFWYGCA
jgi:hypothetical protein